LRARCAVLLREVPARTLTRQDLNRATLARQMLLERAADCEVRSAVERLAGMQA
jgi:hypothetical protein